MMITPAHLESFSKVLTGIVEAELKLGNSVDETAIGWPTTNNGIVVFLRKPFKAKYQAPELQFREVNDPHYWLSEYLDRTTGHILACKFE